MSNLKALIVATIVAFIAFACGAFVFWTVDFGSLSIDDRANIVWASCLCAVAAFTVSKGLSK